MAFSEKVKKQAREKACFRCVICHRPFVEVHHILPQSEGGADTLENAAPLCAECHDLYGANPQKRKQIRQMRDHWYEQMEKRYRGELDLLAPIPVNVNAANAMKDQGIAIYHNVYAHEDFTVSAQILVKLVFNTQQKFPDQKRILYLDIEGHRNAKGGFDSDMLELQKDFVGSFLMPYLHAAHMPLISLENRKVQRNDVYNELLIYEPADQ